MSCVHDFSARCGLVVDIVWCMLSAALGVGKGGGPVLTTLQLTCTAGHMTRCDLAP